MYELARGPFMWASLLICLAGCLYRAFQIYGLTAPKEQAFYTVKPPEKKPAKDAKDSKEPPKPVEPIDPKIKYEQIARFQNSMPGKHPVMTIVTSIFHFCLLVTPVFVVAHSLIVRETLGFKFLTLPDGLSDALTLVLLACCLFFLVRRLVLPTVSAVSSANDYFLLLITALPFLTGFLAYHHLFTYRHVILLHMISGEAMLILIPFTKLGHMIFFFIARHFISGEYTLGRGNRTWSVSTNG